MKLGAFDSSEFPYCLYESYPPKFKEDGTDEKVVWRYCVVGNIVAEHTDEESLLRYGTKVFPGGRKVYLTKSFWPDRDRVIVIGLNKFKSRYSDDFISPSLITNIRCSKTYNNTLLHIMSDFEFIETWWGNTPSDRKAAEEFVKILSEYKQLNDNIG